jgi:hypothetical protein
MLSFLEKIKSWFRPKAEPDYQAYQACEDFENSRSLRSFVPGKPGALPDLPAQPDPEPAVDLNALSKSELLEIAQSVGAKASRKMKKQDIIDAINSVQ